MLHLDLVTVAERVDDVDRIDRRHQQQSHRGE
jgi:hypothetical protein